MTFIRMLFWWLVGWSAFAVYCVASDLYGFASGRQMCAMTDYDRKRRKARA